MATRPTPEQLCDIEACREAAMRYSRGVDRLDADEMKSAYWPDGTDDHGVFVGNAYEFCDRVVSTHDKWVFTMHSIYNHAIELDDDGEHARGEAYNISWLMAEDGGLNMWFGRYLDQYERRGDEWRIMHRVCVHEGDRAMPPGTPMQIPAEKFRQGNFDRPADGRPLGP